MEPLSEPKLNHQLLTKPAIKLADPLSEESYIHIEITFTYIKALIRTVPAFDEIDVKIPTRLLHHLSAVYSKQLTDQNIPNFQAVHITDRNIMDFFLFSKWAILNAHTHFWV